MWFAILAGLGGAVFLGRLAMVFVKRPRKSS
jgi:hypothetical protein